MPYIVLRLIPAAAIDPGTFATSYLAGLTVKVYDVSFAGTASSPLGPATIVQHVTTGITPTPASVATAVIPVPAATPEYVSPNIQVAFVRGTQTVLDPTVYYDVPLLTGTLPANYQDILSSDVSAYVTLPAPASSTAAAPLQLPTNGNPPDYDDLLTAVTKVLAKDPGPATLTNAQAAAWMTLNPLTLNQCQTIAYEIVYGPQPPLPGPPESLENMYTDPPNSGAMSDSNQQDLSAFQGSLTSYYAQNNATAALLTNFVFSLSAALWCELQSKAATSAILEFPVNPNASPPPTNATVSEAEIILTVTSGNLGIDVPAQYFYALCAQVPAQMTALQRYAMAISSDPQQSLDQLTDAVSAGWITAQAINPAQAVRALGALDVPAASTVTTCDITLPSTSSIKQIWTDWLAFPSAAWPGYAALLSKIPGYTYQAGDDLTDFWPAEANATPAAFLDLVLCVLTQAYVVDPVSKITLATEIKTNLKVGPTPGLPITTVGGPGPCLANALPSDWQTFFGPPPPPNLILVNLLPTFTLPGTPQVRVAAFIRHFQSFFGVQSVTANVPTANPAAPPNLNLPASDLIATTIAIGSLAFPLTAAQLSGLDADATTASGGDTQAKAWVLQAITTINNLATLTKPPIVPSDLQFSVMEALYARGFTRTDDVLDLPSADFQQALTGTVAYDFAAQIQGNAGAPHKFPPIEPQTFTPINPGSLTDCVPPLYLSPLGPTAYLQEMLKVSEGSTCDDPFPAAHTDVQPQNLAAVIAPRRGPIGTTLLATRANLQTPLPLIDIVNECLEYAASTKPNAGNHGTVYNTAEDTLAGHTLCVEECCTEREKNDAACHDPATLFAALPEYSTPGTPSPSGALVRLRAGGFSNSEVEPAGYDILKADFSSCCLPYSQALDVSRTYLEHFRSCRFEVMRTFRKCITEFVLDPKNPPAEFKPYLWRYPVRIDIAIEYLGITPEEYVAVFGGVWPAPCDAPATNVKPLIPSTGQLYGFADKVEDNTWTETVVQLPEFLKRTCVTYCEFLELWKCGFVTFRNASDEAGQFPDCEPCCLDKLQLKFPVKSEEEIPLGKLAVFIRLWHKLKRLCGGGYSFQQLADICTVLPLFNGNAANPDFIRQLAAFQMLRDQLRLPLTDEHAATAAGAAGADRTFLLSLWAVTAHQWDWALERFIEGIAHYAACRYGCERREPEFLKQLAGNLDCLSRLAGFDPATSSVTWHAAPTHTLRFAEILAKLYASKFSIGEIVFLFAGDDSQYGGYGHEEHAHAYDDKHEHEKPEHAYDDKYDHDEHDHDHDDHEHDEREHEQKPSPWQLRRKLLERHVPREETEDWTWSRLESALHHEFGLAGEHPSLQRQQAMFDCWERVFDYDRVRKELGERSECHLRYFQDQTVPVYALTTEDLEDDRWMVRTGHAGRWIRSLSHCFRVKDFAQACPELWAADDPAALVAGETETGNANLSRFLGDGCLETGAPRLYGDLKRLNDRLRERGRDALVAYLCGVNGIKKTPKELSDLLLLDVETGLCEKASRIEEAITAVQTFIQRCRIGLEASWKITPQFAHMWESRFTSYHVWQACKRRELYKENLIDWHELEKAKQVESFRFMDEELRRISLTIAAPGGVDYWPEHRPPAPGLCLLQERDPATMQLLSTPREGLGLLATPERDGRPSWLTTESQQKTAASRNAAAGPPIPATPPTSGGPLPPNLPIWMESAIKLGTRFVRVAAAGYQPASTPFEPWKSSRPAGSTEESCVECCAECGCRHPAHVDEYYFWLVDGRHFDPHDAQRSDPNTPSAYTYDAQQNAYYDPNAQESTPWHNPTQLPNLLEWPSKPMVRLAWCRLHNGEFQQRRISDHGIAVTSASGADISFLGRGGDSLYFTVTNASAPAGFRYDLAEDLADAEDNPTVAIPPSSSTSGGLSAYPYFVYFTPGARLFPWSPYSPAIAVANSLRAHCRFESALKWYDLFYDPLVQDNTWAKCPQGEASQPSPQPTPAPQLGTAAAAPVVAVAPAGAITPAVTATPVVPATPAISVAATPAVPATPAIPVAAAPAVAVAGATGAPANNAATTCCDSTDVSCHVARQRSVLLHYLETLVEWGDALMRRDSPEQFQQARVIFDSARTILGPRPHKVANPAGVNPTAATVATFIPPFAPINPRLVMLYDRLDDRMALIRDCLDKRRLRQASERHDAQYWGRDPVRDGWRSDLSHCCDEEDWCHPHSPYRFTFLIQKAKELANQTRELGGALLAAFEKGDAEYLASMRAVHERGLLALGRKVREGEWRDADFQVQALQKTKESDQASRRYYANLIANGLISNETAYVKKTGVALHERTASNISEAIAEGLTPIPDMFIGTAGVTTQPPMGTKGSDLFKVIARIMTTLADIASTTASLDLTKAGWDRRLQDWIHQVQILDIQIEQVELQILGAERRRDDSLRQLNSQQRQIEQSTEVMNFLRDKFTNHAVYLFLQKNTADLHCRMYELALSAAREAERAFHFERGHDTRRFVSCEGWDNLHEGLLAGERLQLSLAQMEKEYCDRNRREYELSKHISLRLQFPAEFLRLKLTGRCEIDLAEWRFDQDYPGHFMRRIKNATITIPAVSGPYNGVHCRLTLLRSSTRVDPLLSLAPAHCCNTCKSGNGYEVCPHDPRVVRQYAATEAIATSSGQNDSGLFELNFHDDRYLPFEFHGAASTWRIELPPDNNYFDMDTLSDVILHLNYTSREGGERLRHAAKEAAEKRLPAAGWCLFDVPHDFPDAWELSRTNHDEKQHGDKQRGDKRPRHLNLKFGRDLFPFVPGHRELRIDKMALLFDTCEKPDRDCCAGECACGEDKIHACWRVGFKGHRGECEETEICCAAGEDWSDLYYGVVDARMGALGRNGDRQEARLRFPAEVGELSKLFLLCRYEVASPCLDK
jgi:Tc toxin complex TcA C-terminal TcB-binding domain